MARPTKMTPSLCMAMSFAFATSVLSSTNTALAIVKPTSSFLDPSHFPTPLVVRKQTRFWERVFGRYPSTKVIIHDAEEPDRMVDIIDYKVFAKRNPKLLDRSQRDQVTRAYLKRYDVAIDRFKRLGKRATEHGAIEKRLYKVYGRSPKALSRLYKGQVRLRAQTGLADDFRKAASIAKSYLPKMEQIFAEHNVPTVLTRIAFVESMFNPKARSRVGASGIWQFMPATARDFIFVNDLVDERNAPLKATSAAARLFSLNYSELRSWPLAITAYNHGRAGMMRAVKLVGSADIGAVIERYRSGTFGFASKNFYSEFLAAANTYHQLARRGLIEDHSPLPKTETITLQKKLSVSQLIRYTPLSKDILIDHNPCLKTEAFTKYKYRALPPFYELRVPNELAHKVKVALMNIRAKRYARR